MESAIRGRMMQIPLIGQDGNVLRVMCGSTTCEIAGSLIDVEHLVSVVDAVLRGGASMSIPSVTVAPRATDSAGGILSPQSASKLLK